MKRKICIVTGSRAEYGLLRNLIFEIKNDKNFQLQVIATGMHLSPEFGLTYKEIEKDKIKINKKIELIISGDTEVATAKAVGLGCISFSEAFTELDPHIIVILGDRYEILAAGTAAMICKIPIAHIHGGELTEGAIDDSIRHALTKLANIHFAVTDQYKKRIIQMGESPAYVFNCGSPGLDDLHRIKFLNKSELGRSLNFNIDNGFGLCTFHPVTRNTEKTDTYIRNILKAVKSFDHKIIFTKANSDMYGRKINQEIEKFCANNQEKYRLFDSLGHIRYLSALSLADFMIGNSSSGYTECPSFKVPVINIGDRQKGRIKADNIIDTDYKTESIIKALKKINNKDFLNKIKNTSNPYDKFQDGKNCKRIKDVLKKVNLQDSKLMQKKFYDIDFKIDN